MVYAKLFHPRNRGNSETAYGIKDCDGLDGDELSGATTFEDARETILDEQAPVVFGRVFTSGLVVEGDTRVRILVILGLPILHIFKDGEEEFHSFTGQETEASNHAGDAAGGEGATREADENNLVAVDVVAAYK